MAKKLYGNTGDPGSAHRRKRRKKGSGMKKLAIFLALILFVELAYCTVIFTDLIPPLSRLRTMYIETAMSTMRHQWLAKALIPGDVVQEVIDRITNAQLSQDGVNSGWDDVPEHNATEETKSPSSGFSKDAAADLLSQIAQNMAPTKAEKEFFQLFAMLIFLKRGKALDGALTIGKICTTVLFGALFILVLLPNLSEVVTDVITGVCCFFLIISFIEYIRAYCGKNKKIHDLER